MKSSSLNSKNYLLHSENLFFIYSENLFLFIQIIIYFRYHIVNQNFKLAIFQEVDMFTSADCSVLSMMIRRESNALVNLVLSQFRCKNFVFVWTKMHMKITVLNGLLKNCLVIFILEICTCTIYNCMYSIVYNYVQYRKMG